MSYPSRQQFALDLSTLYFDYCASNSPMPDALLQSLVSAFSAAFVAAQSTERPNEAYHHLLKACVKALIAFHRKLDPRAFAADSSALFSQKVLLDLALPIEALVSSVAEAMPSLSALGMFRAGQLYHVFTDSFSDPEPTFDRREPIAPDPYQRRDFREAKERFRQDHKTWIEEKRQFEKDREKFLAELDPLDARFNGTFLWNFAPLLPRTFEVEIPLVVDEQSRMQHMWVVADSGHGKTQLFQRMILEDLKEVAAGRRSIIVIDSQNKLIPNIAKLQFFAPGQPLHGRLSVLNPMDVDLALNLFDLRLRLNSNDRQRRTVINATLELYSFLFSSLLAREMTGKQETLFAYVAELLFQVDGATIHDFRNIMRKGGIDKYRPVIEGLPSTSSVRQFFENGFTSSDYAQTKSEVESRIDSLLRNATFEAMFGQKECKLNLLAEINSGRVILVNTAESLLFEAGVRFFGRFVLALIGNAVAERAAMTDERAKIPTYVYLDEAYQYIKDDKNFVGMLARARKQYIGLTVAQQWLGQLDDPVYEGLAAIANTIVAGGVSPSDAFKIAQMMSNSDPDFVRRQPDLTFAFFNKKATPEGAVAVAIPYGVMEKLPTMTAVEYQQQLAYMRHRFGPSIAEESYDLHWEITISPKLARNGGQTREHGFLITIPPGTKDGAILRLKGQGRPNPDGSYGHVFLKVHVPKLHQTTEGLTGSPTDHPKKEPPPRDSKVW
ncbi:hypothetical protein [Bradyrhizobium manausense]|nr:hypothetical protein [Bradyrhizobium manausense]